MKNCLYILLCSNGRYYVGSALNLELRLKDHERGQTKSTRYLKPLKLCFAQEFTSLLKARRAENWLKRQKNKDFILRIIVEGGIDKNFD